MSEYKICPICGGYIGNAILYATVATTSTVPSPPITFCPGHVTTDAYLAGHSRVMYTGVVPQGTSVSLYSFTQHEDTLWQIVQGVAETESEYGTSISLDDTFLIYRCPFCSGEIPTDEFARGAPFPHEQTCIVTKARALMEWRKAQPKMEVKVVYGEVDFEETLRHKAHLITKAFEIPPQLVGELDGEVPRD